MKTWKQLFTTSYIAKIKRLKQCRKKSSTNKEHNTSCNSHTVCESDDWWATYHNCLIVWKSFAWRCKKTIAWYFIIKKYWRPIWTISWRLYKILDTTQTKWNQKMNMNMQTKESVNIDCRLNLADNVCSKHFATWRKEIFRILVKNNFIF